MAPFVLLLCLLPFGAQLLLLHLTRKRFGFLRWLIALGGLVPAGFALYLLFSGSIGSWSTLGAIIYGGVAAMIWLGWGAAWGLFLYRKKHKENSHEKTPDQTV